MIEKISSPVSVTLSFDHTQMRVTPKAIVWNKRLYSIVKVGFHHTYQEGKVLYHVFSVASKTLFFRLVLNPQNLYWRLEEISDGKPS